MIMIFLAFLAAAAQPAPAQQSQSPAGPAPASRPWQVDWGRYYCTLIRQPGEGRPYAAAFMTVPGADLTTLMLVPEGRARLPHGVTSVVLLPSGRSFDVPAIEQQRGERRVLVLGHLPYALRDELEGAAELQLRAGAAVRLRIPMNRARAAVAAHRRCTAEISREWRIDEAGLAALRERPDSTNRLGYRPDDYPSAALRTATQGRVIMRITVTAEGRAADCEVVATSGSREIDTTSCRIAMRNGRYTPGRDAAGQPVTIASVFTVTWLLPSR